MSLTEQPCVECSLPAALGHAVCPHCGASLLVDVALTAPIKEPRIRFALAKSLAAIDQQPFSEWQAALAALAPRLAVGVTRARAATFVEAVTRQGLRAKVDRSQRRLTGDVPLAPSRSSALVLLAIAFIGAGGAVVSWKFRKQVSRLPGMEFVAPGPTSSTSAADENVSMDVIEAAIASTVSIRCANSVGAGFFVTPTQVLTNAHVVCPQGELMKIIVAGGRTVMGTVRATDSKHDLALVDVAGASGEPLPFADAAALRAGESVIAVGSPRGLEFTTARGSVSFVGRAQLGVAYVQVDINVNPGNSGGPLLDAKGRVVGIVSMMIRDSTGLALALPVNYAWSGTSPLVEAPAEHVSSAQWKALLARVAKDDERETITARGDLSRPGLLGAVLRPDGSLVAFVFKHSVDEPKDNAFVYQVVREARSGCTAMNGHSLFWNRLDDGWKGAADSQTLAWLEERKLLGDVWVGVEKIFPVCDEPLVVMQDVLRIEPGNPTFRDSGLTSEAAFVKMLKQAEAHKKR